MAKKKVEEKIKFVNGFAALNASTKKTKKSKAKEAAANDDKAVFAFASQKSGAWGDDSDEEGAAPGVIEDAAQVEAEEEDDEEEDSEEDSEEEEEEEEEETAKEVAPKAVAPKAAAAPVRELSKKEKKQLELEEFEKALAELGITPEASAPAEEVVEAAVDTPAGESSASKKKKKKGKKPSAAAAATDAPAAEESADVPAVVDIKNVLKAKATKGKKKTTTENSAQKLAREEALKAKNAKKKNRDKATFNEFSY